MTGRTKLHIFDGHNDVLAKLARKQEPHPERCFLEGGQGHIDLPRARLGGFAGGFFAVFAPCSSHAGFYEQMARAEYALPLPPQMPQTKALKIALQQAAILIRLERAGALDICKTTGDLHHAMKTGRLAAIFHMEGADAVDPDFTLLDVFFAAGLRSLGLVWSRPNRFAHGVPFRFPGDPDTGAGLSGEGRALVKACNERGILIDLSHLNEKGFWDVAALSDAPLVATHSNAHVLCASSRNLTDKQLAAIRESDGMVGVNFATALLREDGRMRADTGLDVILRHFDYLIAHLGEDRVGFGSDFDGAVIPAAIGDVAGLPKLYAAMREHGFGETLMEKLCYGNWLRVLAKTWRQ